MISALAELDARFSELAADLRKNPAVLVTSARLTPRSYTSGDRVECYVDAELTSGNTVGFWLEFGNSTGYWIIESSIRINRDEGEDELVSLANRYAVEVDELIVEARSATDAIFNAAQDLDLSAL